MLYEIKLINQNTYYNSYKLWYLVPQIVIYNNVTLYIIN